MDIKRVSKFIGTVVITSVFSTSASYALCGNGFDVKFYNNAKTNQNLNMWTMLKDGYKPAHAEIIHGDKNGTNDLIIPISRKKDVDLEVRISDQEDHTVWNGTISFHSGTPEFVVQTNDLDPNYSVSAKTDANKHFVAINID